MVSIRHSVQPCHVTILFWLQATMNQLSYTYKITCLQIIEWGEANSKHFKHTIIDRYEHFEQFNTFKQIA